MPEPIEVRPDPIEVRKVPLHTVSDASELQKLIDAGVLDADRVIAVVGKTEGNGGVNDYTRIIADRAFREVLTANGARDVQDVPIVWSGGTDGVISPHATIFATVPASSAPSSDEPRLTVGFAMSEPIRPEDIGRTAMITKVAAAVGEAMKRAGIDDPDDVHYVQTKTPLLTIDTIRDAKARGHDVFTEDTLTSMDVSNGTTALGIAVALGEINMPTDADVLRDRTLYSSVASCSSGVELDRAQVVVVGNARGIGGRYRIGHGVMRDALDADGIWAAIRSAGLELPPRPHPDDLQGRLVNVFLKCEASQDGQVRGRRNAMLDDSDVHWHRQIKACVGGVAAAVTGDPAVFVSVSAAHQGPDGGGPVAAIVDLGCPPDRFLATRRRMSGRATKTESTRLDGAMKTFDELFAELTERQRLRPDGSATVEALDAGVHAQGKKVVEEAAEAWMAAEHESAERTAEEISQLLYRVQVLMLGRGLTLADVYRHL